MINFVVCKWLKLLLFLHSSLSPSSSSIPLPQWLLAWQCAGHHERGQEQRRCPILLPGSLSSEQDTSRKYPAIHGDDSKHGRRPCRSCHEVRSSVVMCTVGSLLTGPPKMMTLYWRGHLTNKNTIFCLTWMCSTICVHTCVKPAQTHLMLPVTLVEGGSCVLLNWQMLKVCKFLIQRT